MTSPRTKRSCAIQNQASPVRISAVLMGLTFASVVLSGCDSNGVDPHPIPQTSILWVTVTPNPVLQGRSTTFRVGISDSTIANTRFYWATEEAGGPIVTSMPILEWRASKPPGTYLFSIRVDTGDITRVPPVRTFNVTILDSLSTN